MYYTSGELEEEERQKNTENYEGRESGGFQISLITPRKETGGNHPGWDHGDRLTDAAEYPGSRNR